MATNYSPFQDEAWSHDWDYAPKSFFGDPDETPEHGVIATIRADSPEQAERRVLIYIVANFDDDAPLRAEANPTPVTPGTYEVKIVWRGVR